MSKPKKGFKPKRPENSIEIVLDISEDDDIRFFIKKDIYMRFQRLKEYMNNLLLEKDLISISNCVYYLIEKDNKYKLITNNNFDIIEYIKDKEKDKDIIKFKYEIENTYG